MEGAVLQYVVHGPLYGDVQAVARSETMALVTLLGQVQRGSSIEFVTDFRPT